MVSFRQRCSRRDLLRGRLFGRGAREPEPLVATVMPHACLAYLGTLCDLCATNCPVPGALTVRRGRPVVDPVACTGCGDCASVCPAPGGGVVTRPSDRVTGR